MQIRETKETDKQTNKSIEFDVLFVAEKETNFGQTHDNNRAPNGEINNF